jgi:hypothetical protein
LELGTTEYRPRYPRKALEIRFLNCVLKPVFPCNPVRGFKERICSPAAQGLGSKSSRTPVSLYVPLRKRTRRCPGWESSGFRASKYVREGSRVLRGRGVPKRRVTQARGYQIKFAIESRSRSSVDR